MKGWLFPLAAAAALSVSGVAFAQERVTLADGTVMQGELVEKVPGDHITIKLATGEVRTIQWSALAPQPVAPTFVAPQIAQAPPTGPMVHVAVDGDRPGITLVHILNYGMVQAYTGYGTAYGAFEQSRPVCVAPCQADVEANGMYRIAGEGITPTGTFGLPAQGNVRLHVHGGSLGARVGGLWLLLGGISLTVAGVPLAIIGAADNSSGGDTGLIVSGLVVGGVGVAMLVISIVMLAGSGTSVTTDDGMNVARHDPPRLKLTASGFVF